MSGPCPTWLACCYLERKAVAEVQATTALIRIPVKSTPTHLGNTEWLPPFHNTPDRRMVPQTHPQPRGWWCTLMEFGCLRLERPSSGWERLPSTPNCSAPTNADARPKLHDAWKHYVPSLIWPCSFAEQLLRDGVLHFHFSSIVTQRKSQKSPVTSNNRSRAPAYELR